ncbi:LysR family transcriptional regulator [Bradyrhizobium liaoningense]|uniref:LysR family transcriptional regulator n=1 Tax=Bradyrhizobium liaoningense TaxID=43992 RepID=UPI001BACD992|nr:LysR family transcriptional regulator [Bradyrhizobium liaoningense]MBR0859216.1 LysR family transcriptional regulator [Bradyrhizobium liaoningense]
MRLSNSLLKLELFVRAVEAGSLSKAARSMNLTPSAVSKGLSQLEDQLGTTLLKRTTRNMVLTDSGALMYERATSILRDAESALNAALQFREPCGTLRVSCSVALGCTQLSPMLRDFMRIYPKVQVSLSLDDRLVDLSSEEFDVALRITSRHDWDYPGRLLASISWVYAASPNYLRESPALRVPEDLMHHSCLLYPAMTVHREWGFLQDRRLKTIKIPCSAVSNSSLALAEMAIDDCGIVCIPRYVAQKYLSDGRLEIVLPDYRPAIEHRLYAMYFKTRHSNPALRAFVDFLAEKFKKDTF